MPTPVYTVLGGVNLPPDLLWTDEYEFAPVRVKRDISIAGNQILQVARQQAGRNITLSSGERGAWLTRAQLDALTALRDDATLTIMTLTLPDLRAFSVVFDLTQSPCFTAAPLRPGKFTDAGDYFKVILKLLTV